MNSRCNVVGAETSTQSWFAAGQAAPLGLHSLFFKMRVWANKADWERMLFLKAN